MTGGLLLVGLLIASFVAYNIGGSSTGAAFGPVVGADAISKTGAAALMSVFFFVGAWTIGRRVVTTLGRDLLHDASLFRLEHSILILLFIGTGLLLGNVSGDPASTSMTAVGAIVGLGVAADEFRWAVVGEIVWKAKPVHNLSLGVALRAGVDEQRSQPCHPKCPPSTAYQNHSSSVSCAPPSPYSRMPTS